ncbi:MAG: YdbL family protein [Magnetococcales bacterium]|nr:YdbL family protein [Magnetococcales bacterium]
MMALSVGRKLTWLLLFVLGACVTVNVYFPAPAVDQAAERIVREVWSGMTPPAPPPVKQSPTGTQPADGHSMRSNGTLQVVNAVLSWLVTPAVAADLNVSTAAIRAVSDSLKSRASGALKPFLFNGQVGINREGDLEIRSEEGLTLQQKGELRTRVREDNADRAALYREIAAANGHTEWEGEIRERFALKWISEAPSGWQVQKPDGAWVKK